MSREPPVITEQSGKRGNEPSAKFPAVASLEPSIADGVMTVVFKTNVRFRVVQDEAVKPAKTPALEYWQIYYHSDSQQAYN
jgi:hypothetical protein